MKYNYIRAIGGFMLIGMAWWMVYTNKQDWGWLIFAAMILLLSTITLKKDILSGWSIDDEEDDGPDYRDEE